MPRHHEKHYPGLFRNGTIAVLKETSMDTGHLGTYARRQGDFPQC